MKQMICMVGIPRSGKSTYVNKLENYQILCPDDIRMAFGTQFDDELEEKVWFTFDIMLKAIIHRGLNVCIDATNTKPSRVYKFKYLAELRGYHFKIILMDTSKEECYKRNVGERTVPEEVIDRMAAQLEEFKTHEIFINSEKEII